jgi:hypothetical protein
MKFLRMRPGHGEQLIAEGDPQVAEDAERLIEEFRRQLDRGMWAAVPLTTETGRREAEMVTSFEDIPVTTDRVIFFPRAAGGAHDEGAGADEIAGGTDEIAAAGGEFGAAGGEFGAAGGAPEESAG